MSVEIPGLCKLYMLQLTKASMNILNFLEDYIHLINDNGEFSVVGWYQRGVINDESLITSRDENRDIELTCG